MLILTRELAQTSLRLSTTTAPMPCTPLLRLRLVLENRDTLSILKWELSHLNMFWMFSVSAGLALCTTHSSTTQSSSLSPSYRYRCHHGALNFI